jgi:hypothetical protein
LTPACSHTACTLGSCDQPEEGVDLDRDGVPDRLEYDLAHRFFPRIKLQTSSEDLRQSYLFHDRSIPYMVRPLPPVPHSPCSDAYKCLEIRYGIAYFRDTGDIGGISSHLGDSEFYAYDMRGYKDTRLLQNIGRVPRVFNIGDLTSFDHTIQHPSCGTYHVWSGRDFGGAGDYRSKFLADIPWVLN